MSISFNSGGEKLEVSEIDGSPDITGVQKILVSNGSLTDDGGGEITIVTGATSPGGSDTEIQYNNSSSFDGASGLTTDGSSLTITDDNYLKLGTASNYNLRYNSASGRFQISDAGGNVFLSITDAGTTAITNLNDLDINSSGLTGKLTIKGDGTSSATTSVIIEDSSDIEKFKITDNGTVKITGQSYSPTITLVDGATVTPDFDNGNIQKLTLGGNRIIANASNLEDGATYILLLIQDGTGSRTVTWGANYIWSGATAPTLTTTADKTDIITFVSDGTYLYGTSVLNF